ncbi:MULTISPECIES: Asp-tRNA(Asn)/Glu-tRNA(Gln) amidotransferase subunit GatA [Thalassolituus]|uniref:Glutamyl-tRNA(Gln) amidotransferase subunit A n=1 Tax=Thalassolituus maritimus TaxID=484498 RepID=A0A1N7NK89_9GAMM|nr:MULTISPECIES: Asp-tRNA(Asn)/Glu-tRNA(Gln) amidotransferase subunit GatA [Thalassolituus]MAX87979.1 Asp-tRNA(Asn)/Glu-tRNA(Gln) amidotransferase GatCAB subunit A [Oceanospirillaceae bacterium]TPD53622.1 MAG: Asp-tRNA(Asn)/Glu-tRNA(Gln) amidotransferase subunit GatA [Thalassolituus maritimus]SIS98786.1 aspartyl/glutamyl-tRNA(Asn/Gln) amidotransferase subunit A [Thalassolituus maritimus]|tara:strand:+ start:8739 stop:10193 length:1455 start_codon:yes stop_codon:yes gene_type:complete
MHNKTIAEISRDLAAGEYSSTEITTDLLARVKDLDKGLNSFITVTEEQALAQAKAADERRAAGNATPWTGVPMAHKDIFCTKGVLTTCGSKMLSNFEAPYDATVVENFNNAGAVSLGKTNMDEFAMGSSNETSYFGPVKNPWDTDRVPGGSSGGSAAAVAARLVPGATATDTGGSIRQPAALCGITGLKPTYGRVSRWGMIAFASSLDQAGTMTRTVEDSAMMMNVMASFDKKDSTCVERDVPDYTSTLNDSIEGMTIGLPTEYFRDDISAEMQQQVRNAIAEYEKMGAKVKEISLPNTHLSVPTYYVVAPAECSANLSRMDGVRFGYRCEDPKDIEDLYCRSRGEGFGNEVKRRIMVGAYALSAGFYDAYYKKAQQVRRLIKNDFVEAFKDVDVIMSPTSPTPAFKFGEKTDDPVAMYLEDIFTIATNLAGLPGMSVPCGQVNNLPVGLQLIGNYFDEARILNAGHKFQQATDWHLKAPQGIE